jgi:hypothetical protein
MRKRRPVVAGLLVGASVLVVAQAVPAAAVPAAFGAKLTKTSQPTPPERCDQNGDIPNGAICTWVATTAFENGDHFKAPKDGTIRQLKLISCVAGTFRLQLARVKFALHQAKVVRNGPIINYAADPRQTDGNPQTSCGGDDGDDYIIQTFPVNVSVKTGDYIAVRAQRLGFIHNSGGGNTFLFAPPLAPGGPFEVRDDNSSADLMLRLIYGPAG